MSCTNSTPRPRPREGERGTILVVTVLLVTLTIVIVADARHVARIEWEAASNADTEFQLEKALQGGYQIAEAYLRQDLQDSPDTDHKYEEWGNAEGIQKDMDPSQFGIDEYSQPTESASGEERTNFPKIRIFIEDEERKWPLPLLRMGSESLKERRKEALAKLIEYYRANTQLQVDAGAATQYADMIVNFVSREESDSSFEPTPRPSTKSGMLMSSTDLALIKGIPEHLIYDTVDEDGNIAKGLMHFVTVWTDLVINVNTADQAVLRAVMRPEDETVGADIWAKREEKGEEFLEYDREQRDRFGDDYRRNPDRQERSTTESEEEESTGYWSDIESIKDDVDTFTDRILNDVRLYLGVKSNVFSIWVEAELKGIKRRRRWVVRREGARFVPIISEHVQYPFFRYLTEDEQQGSYERQDW